MLYCPKCCTYLTKVVELSAFVSLSGVLTTKSLVIKDDELLLDTVNVTDTNKVKFICCRCDAVIELKNACVLDFYGNYIPFTEAFIVSVRLDGDTSIKPKLVLCPQIISERRVNDYLNDFNIYGGKINSIIEPLEVTYGE